MKKEDPMTRLIRSLRLSEPLPLKFFVPMFGFLAAGLLFCMALEIVRGEPLTQPVVPAPDYVGLVIVDQGEDSVTEFFTGRCDPGRPVSDFVHTHVLRTGGVWLDIATNGQTVTYCYYSRP